MQKGSSLLGEVFNITRDKVRRFWSRAKASIDLVSIVSLDPYLPWRRNVRRQ
jgi:hypothetical protein